MLVIGRKIGQYIVIRTPQGDIEIAVAGTKTLHGERQINLAIEAPRSFEVARNELLGRSDKQWKSKL